MTTLTLSKALNAGLRKALENDPKVLIMGEDVGKLGGVFRVTDGLQKDFGEDRVIDTPLAESGIVGTAIGLALRGYRPVCEIQFDGFVYPAANQIVSQLAKMRYRSRGHVALPVTIRIPCGGGIGAVEHHSESPEVLFAHTAGLQVVACADAADAFAMIQQSVSCDDPQSGSVHEQRFRRLAVMLDRADPAAERDPDDDGQPDLAARAVVHLGELADDLIEGGEHEPVELDLADRAVSAQRQADGGADDAGLGQRGVDHPRLAEVLLQAVGHPEDPAQLADILAHDECPGVVLQRLAQALVDRPGQRQPGHRCSPAGSASAPNESR